MHKTIIKTRHLKSGIQSNYSHLVKCRFRLWIIFIMKYINNTLCPSWMVSDWPFWFRIPYLHKTVRRWTKVTQMFLWTSFLFLFKQIFIHKHPVKNSRYVNRGLPNLYILLMLLNTKHVWDSDQIPLNKWNIFSNNHSKMKLGRHLFLPSSWTTGCQPL